MKEEGRVVSVKDGLAVIETDPREACTKCCSCRAAKPQRITVKGDKAEGLRAGDKVEINVGTSSMMKVYMLLYALPAAVFLAAILSLYFVTASPVISFAGALAATVASYVFSGRYIAEHVNISPDVCVKNPS